MDVGRATIEREKKFKKKMMPTHLLWDTWPLVFLFHQATILSK